MKASVAATLTALFAMVLVASAVPAVRTNGIPLPLPQAAGPLRAAASPIVFLGEMPANNSYLGLLNPVVAMAVSYVDLLHVPIAAVDFHLDELNLTSAGTFNNTLFTVPIGFALRNGPHEANFLVVDTLGNSAWDNWTFTVDTVLPYLVVTFPAYPIVPVHAIPVEGVAIPAPIIPPQVNVTVTALPSHLSSWALTNATTGAFTILTPLSEGPNVLFVNATDAAGNVATEIVKVISDTIKPALRIVTPLNLSVSPTSVVRVAGISEFGAYLTVNGFSVVVAPTGTWSVDLAFPEGPNVIVAAASDQVGNLNYTAVGILVDSDAPRITLASPLPSLTNRSSIVVSGTVQDTRVVALVARCGPILRPLTFDAATGSFSTTFTGLPDATYPVQVTAVDAAQRSTTVGANVVVDTTPPVVRLSTPPDGLETTQPTVQLAGTVNEANATVLVNDQVVRPDGGHWQTTVSLVEGSNVVQISAVDAAGNRAAPILLHASYFSPYPDLANRTATNENDIAALAGFARLSLVAIAVLAIGVELVLYSRTERKVREDRRLLVAALRAMKKRPKAPGP